MKSKFIILIAALLSFNTISKAQLVNNVESDVLHFFKTGGDMASDFVRFDSPAGWNLAASAAILGAGYALDNGAHSLASRNRTNFNNSLFSFDKFYGSGYTLIGMAGLYGYGVIFKNTKVRRLGLETIEAVGYAGLITSVIKSVVGRSRPYTDEGHHRFRPLNVHAAYTSFPSGHATLAFALSTVLAKNTDNIYLKVLCYSAASLTAMSRVYHNAHWLSDVAAGGLVGYFVGSYVADHEKDYTPKNGSLSFLVTPTSLNIVYSF